MKYAVTALIGLVLLATAVHAMPTQDQIKKVEPLVADLMRNDQEDVKRGKKTRTEVAESAMKLADRGAVGVRMPGWHDGRLQCRRRGDDKARDVQG